MSTLPLWSLSHPILTWRRWPSYTRSTLWKNWLGYKKSNSICSKRSKGLINNLKKMLALLLDRKKKKSLKKLRSRASSSKGKGKEKEGEYSTSENTESENSEFENLESSSGEEDNSESRYNHSKRMMSELEKCLEALANWSNLQEAGWSGCIWWNEMQLHTF